MRKLGNTHTGATGVTRRGFLIGMTAAGVSFGFPRTWAAMDPATPNGAVLPDAAQVYEPSLWYSIDSAGKIKVNIIRAEMGQHVGTSIARILAEELEADWQDIEIIHVDSNEKWGLMVTGGSWSVSQSWSVYRQAGAAGKTALLEAAAKQWNVSPSKCQAIKGKIVYGNNTLSYGELVAKGLSRQFSEDELKALPLKANKDLSLVGHHVTSLDIVNKTNGNALFGIDAKIEGMVYACPILPPTRNGSSVASIDDSAAKSIKGYQQTLALDDPSETAPGWVMVIASSFYAAQKAAKKVKVTWQAGAAASVSEADFMAEGRKLIQDPKQGAILDTGSHDTDTAFTQAASSLEQEYLTHTVLHAQMEPLNALAFLNSDKIWEVHSGCQWQSLTLPSLAAALGVTEKDIIIRSYLLGGGFGRRLNGDYTVPAALASKALGGKPVKMVLMRPEDLQFDSPRSSSVQLLKMAFDQDKKVSAMEHHAAAGWPTKVMVPVFMPKGTNGESYDPFSISGADHWYSVGAQKVRAISNELANSSFRPGWLRSVGPGWTGWAVESFMDEAAHHVGADPLTFRLDHLIAEGRNAGVEPISIGGAARQAAVLKKAAAMIGWGQAQAPDTGLGIASTFGQERDMPTWVAVAVQVHVNKSNGLVTVQKLHVAVDAGIIVDPDGAEAQCQGAALWGLSMALYEGTEFVNGKIKDANFDTYTPLRLSQTPEVKVEFIPSTAAPAGLGEPATTPVAPAIANAIFNAVGVRLRSLPMTPNDVKAALAKA
ncbi:MAG: molybdopterin-dependent oxidoreductase [Paraglaciecola sp.]|uniref:xanthine dehydrogenase family protein molybdopterin-binding subunit n=1 Tax=Paraglaciecola sp. TaxID=1920173 RepID=UPI0027400006|nr:molybdopterin cofactor-binding domain-containing protein [Paraglaciecola sp.]MDP5030367.1 molybdopterin-dependent oxidoreductase [Paraglaciecola sp.]MDP5132252.1 molybdopterin-dependent oxidoreductase [Paraglaciecola sp.]